MLTSMLKTKDPLIDDIFLEELMAIIEAFQYELQSFDYRFLAHIIDRAVEVILNKTNQGHVPVELRNYLLDTVVGEFFTLKILTKSLPADFDFEQAVKSIREGDSEVTFLDGSGESARDQFIGHVSRLYYQEVDWLCYRKLKW